MPTQVEEYLWIRWVRFLFSLVMCLSAPWCWPGGERFVRCLRQEADTIRKITALECKHCTEKLEGLPSSLTCLQQHEKKESSKSEIATFLA
jgi:hypothetical protein